MDHGYISMTVPRMGKINQFLSHWRKGRKYGYPICCIFRFSLESAKEDGKTFYFEDGYQTSAMRRGMIVRSEDSKFVPCGIFHHKTHNFDEIDSQKFHPI